MQTGEDYEIITKRYHPYHHGSNPGKTQEKTKNMYPRFTYDQDHIFTNESKFFKLPSISQTLVNTLAANEVSFADN